jgi:hypothetical protein
LTDLDGLIRVLPVPKRQHELGKLGAAFRRDVSLVAFTALGDLFVQDSETEQIAFVFLSPFEVIPLDAFSTDDLFQLFRDNPDAASEALHPDRARTLESRLGRLENDEVFVPEPYPMWGGDGSIESYSKGNLWVHVALLTE